MVRALILAVLMIAVGEAGAATVSLKVANPSGAPLKSYPLTTGVPFPQGALSSDQQVALHDEQGREIPLQAACTSKHADGSVRWLLLDFQADIPAAGRTLTLSHGPQVKRMPAPTPLRITETPEAFGIGTGPLQVAISRTRCNGLEPLPGGKFPYWAAGHDGGAYFVADDGQVFRACLDSKPQVEIESQGPLRTVITTRGWYANTAGDRKCQFIIRYHFFAGQPHVKVMYTWLMTEDSRKLRFRDIGFSLPLRSRQAGLWMEDGSVKTGAVSADNPQSLVQYDFDRSKLNGQEAAAQTLGLVTAGGPQGVCALALRDFRQLFPKEFTVTPDRLTFHVWPAHGVTDPNRKIEDANLQYIWYAHEGEVLDFQAPEAYYSHQEGLSENEYRYLRSSANANGMGMAKTHEMWITLTPSSAVDDPAQSVMARALADPPSCLADPAAMCASGVFGAMQPYSPEQFPSYEKLISENFDAEQRMQAFTRDYGMWNFGDSHTSWDMAKRRWNEAYRTWRNTHHGAPRVPWLLYVRSGDPKYLRYAIRNTRHIMDIDYCHYSTPEFEALDYPRGKLKGALNDYKGIVHWHSGNRLTDYNSMTDYALWYYHMTGDRWGFEVAQDWAEAVKAKFTAPFGYRSGTGTMSALVDFYAETRDESYRPIIESFFNHLTTKVQNVNGTVKYSDHVLSYWPQYRDKIIPMGAFPEWENYAPWIERYWDLTHSDAAKKALVAWADAYLEGFGDMSSLWGTREYMNILAYAYLVTKDPKYLGRGVWECDKAVGSVYQGDDELLKGFMQSGQVSLGGYIIQRLPTFMKALAEYGQPVAPDPLMVATVGFQLPFERTRPTIDGKSVKIETTEVLVFDAEDVAFEVTAHTGHSYPERRYQVKLLAPDGKPVFEATEIVPKGNRDFVVKVPADGQKGLYRLLVGAEGSMGRVMDPIVVTPALPVAFPLAGKITPHAGARYFLYVPTGAREVAMTFEPINNGSVTVQATTPDTKARTVGPGAGSQTSRQLKLAPTPAQTGRTWELIMSGESSVMRLSADGQPLPQVLFPEPYPAEVCEALTAALK